MTELPAATPVARPLAALTVALAGVALVQVDAVLTSRVEPSLYVAVATNCWLRPAMTLGAAGVTASDDSVAAGKPRMGSRPWSPPPQPASKASAANPAESSNGVRYLLSMFISFPFL